MREITSLDELKTIELSIMKKVHQFCEEKGIWYVLTYGTLFDMRVLFHGMTI